MKKAILILLLPIGFFAKAQTTYPPTTYPQSNYHRTRPNYNQPPEENPKKRGFDKTKLFTGGSLNLGLSSYYTSLGIAPQFGYSLTHWLDAGVVLNLNYTTQTDDYNDKFRETVYGPGAFVRLFPVNFLFATAQYEFNLIHNKAIPGDGSAPSTYNTNASSLLLGFGYAGGRYRGSNTYYFLSVSWDVLGDVNSPYTNGYGNAIRVIRAGYNIGLFQGRSNNRRRNDNYY